ncbi:hypothetical protein NDU88_004775 [Pleurodeles waltl]|uniref:Uncharacterized protein n=1 Tax=Pleurodeles waltl TaxID=8319 RepID=A0AAV7PFY4_PLEWA|nr:hypothetical protein NDU88_004775 [Pleurodeles waltl]
MLADIRRSLANLSAPHVGSTVQLPPQSQVLAPTAGPATEQVQVVPALPGISQDSTAQALLAVSQILTNINATSIPPPPTATLANDSLQNSVLEIKRQVEALAASRNVPPLQVTTVSPCVNLAAGSLTQATPLEKYQGKVTKQGTIPAKTLTAVEGVGLDTLLSRPGKLASHVALDIKEKIWRGEFVDIFSLIRAKRREVETKEKDAKASSSNDKKPKIEDSITNWLFGFNVFMPVMLEKKPESSIAMICYANKILKADHMYGGNACLEYDRDFRWAKVEDPAIGWDQTEVNVWLECVNNKLPSKQPFRSQYASDKKAVQVPHAIFFKEGLAACAIQ